MGHDGAERGDSSSVRPGLWQRVRLASDARAGAGLDAAPGRSAFIIEIHSEMTDEICLLGPDVGLQVTRDGEIRARGCAGGGGVCGCVGERGGGLGKGWWQ